MNTAEIKSTLSIEQLDIFHVSPGGNDTFVCTSPIDDLNQRIEINSTVLERYSFLEQGCFLTKPHNNAAARFEMAGGEFCGNATRAVACLLVNDFFGEKKLDELVDYQKFIRSSPQEVHFKIESAGVKDPLEVEAYFKPDKSNILLRLPASDNTVVEPFILTTGVKVTIVHLEGISHILVPKNLHPFNKERCKETAKAIIGDADNNGCSLSPDAVGVIWYDNKEDYIEMEPVVLVRSTGTLYYESSCGSGAIALSFLKRQKYWAEGETTIFVIPPSSIPLIVSLSVDAFNQIKSIELEGSVQLMGTLSL